MSKLLMCLLVLSVTACSSGGSDDNTTPPSPPSYSNPTTPTSPGTNPTKPFAAYGELTAAEKALVGADTNGNGVRDDVDAVITATYSDPTEQKVMVTYAQWLTWTTLRGVRNTASTPEELTNLSNSAACAYVTQVKRVGDNDGQAGQFRAKVFNTFERTQAHLAWDASTDGIPTQYSAEPCSELKGVTTP